MATYTLEEWQGLTGHDKQAIKKLRAALNDFEPLAKFAGLGPKMVESLIAKGLAEAGPSSRPAVAAEGYRLTDKGWLASEWCAGRRMTETPSN